MKSKTILIVATLLALSFAGCIENMRDLKERISPAATDETLEPPAPIEQVNVTNETKKAFKAPVARVSMYAEGGALLFKSTFIAEDVATPIRVDEGVPVTLNGVDSDVGENGANITKYTWTFAGQTLEGRQVTLTPDVAGLNDLILTVEDSNKQKDTQKVKLGVAPAPFTLTTTFTTGPIAGGVGVGQAGEGTFEVLNTSEGLVLKATGAVITATQTNECDVSIEVTDSEGETVGTRDDSGAPNPPPEVLTLGELAAGIYTVTIAPFACANPTGVDVEIVVTYVPVLEGIGDDHGHAH